MANREELIGTALYLSLYGGFRINQSSYNGVGIYFIVPTNSIFIEIRKMKLEKLDGNRFELYNFDKKSLY
jgi:hypothetical protein